MIEDTTRDEPRYRNCLRVNCPSRQIHETGDAEPLMICGMYGYKMCYVHSRSCHEGQTCSQLKQSQKQREENQASADHLEEISKPCPSSGYKAPIEKNHGCDHMTCEILWIYTYLSGECRMRYWPSALALSQGWSCEHEFCRQCLAPSKPIRRTGNTGHNEWCRYHSDNLPATATLHPQRYFPEG